MQLFIGFGGLNMMIPRFFDDLGQYLAPGKVLVIFGARQVGKTTLVRNFLRRSLLKFRFDSGDDIRIQELFAAGRLDRLQEYAQGFDLVVLDEAQRVPGIGLGLKMIVDAMPGLQVIATGSSSFDLAGQVGEPLTGRKRTLNLFPVAQLELATMHNRFDLRGRLDEYLIFGGYPEVVAAQGRDEKIRLLNEIASSYLLKDVLALNNIRNSRSIFDLLRLLALQVGSEVSLTELGTQVGISYKTVDRYIDILEKSFILMRLPGLGRNPRTDLRKKNKYYFMDTGIRNALISNFNPTDLRADCGQLWENFLCVERMKLLSYTGRHANMYFWRTNQGSEIDLVEEAGGGFAGFEFKWGVKGRSRPRDWTEFAPNGSWTVVNRDNYLDFVLETSLFTPPGQRAR